MQHKLSSYENMDIFGTKTEEISTNQTERQKYKAFLVKAINTALTPLQKEYLVKYYLGNMKMKDIAKENNINISTVSRTIKRATGKLQKLSKMF